MTNKSRLGRLILQTGLPAYKIAALTDVAFTQLARYYNLLEPIKPHHLRRLADFFGVEPGDLIGLVDPDASASGDGAEAALDGAAGGSH